LTELTDLGDSSVLVTLLVRANHTGRILSVVAGLRASRVVATGDLITDWDAGTVALVVLGVLHHVATCGGGSGTLLITTTIFLVLVADGSLVVTSGDTLEVDVATATHDVTNWCIGTVANMFASLLGGRVAGILVDLISVESVASIGTGTVVAS
jgi:hypothetical protein